VAATDDAALFARYGGRVRMVEGAPWNLKVTHPDDLAVAELLFRIRTGTLPGGGSA
jgi:2-C-methyl-D-erythritol 4-phosphate cytidylyltransferase